MSKAKKVMPSLIVIVSGHGEEGNKDEMQFSELAGTLQIDLLDAVEALSKLTDGCMTCGVLSMIGTTMANLFYRTGDADELSGALEELIVTARRQSDQMRVKAARVAAKEELLSGVYSKRPQ